MYMIQSHNRWIAHGHLVRFHQYYHVLVLFVSNQHYGSLLPALGICAENYQLEAASQPEITNHGLAGFYHSVFLPYKYIVVCSTCRTQAASSDVRAWAWPKAQALAGLE